ncbi:secreted RxLR effector protein 161-like [Manihot esculenta]|uniref:secreted RxLR effector protein 161-like n=1 Tax=Manihot esculenta TaxID=3983 RepID=UPI000B5D874C|nr:secreted RxLR effector protein 161-like [Manihot esculenta]
MKSCKLIAIPLSINEKLSRDDETDRVVASYYRILIGNLLYLIATRDLMFSASMLSRFMHGPSQKHFRVTKRVLSYLRRTVGYGVWYSKEESGDLQGNSDNEWAWSLDDSKSTFGFVFSFGSSAFAWSSKKQEVVAQSTAEAEYIAVTSNQAICSNDQVADILIKAPSRNRFEESRAKLGLFNKKLKEY